VWNPDVTFKIFGNALVLLYLSLDTNFSSEMHSRFRTTSKYKFFFYTLYTKVSFNRSINSQVTLLVV